MGQADCGARAGSEPELICLLVVGRHFEKLTFVFLISEALGESMAGISQNAKTGDLLVFGECVGVASKALCGLTEAAAQVSC